MKRLSSILDDLCFLSRGIGILLLVIILGVGVSKLGIDSLTSRKDSIELTRVARLDNGSYQLTFLGEKFSTPPAIKLGEVENHSGQVIFRVGERQWILNTTLQIEKVEVICNIIGKLSDYLSDLRHRF